MKPSTQVTPIDPHPLADVLFGIVISTTVFVPIILGVFGIYHHLALFGIFIVTIVLIIVYSSMSRMSKSNFCLWFIFSFYLIVNILLNLENYPSDAAIETVVLHVLGIVLVTFSVQWAANNLDLYLVARVISWSLFPLIIAALMNGVGDGILVRRVPFGLHPNWWGEVAFAFAVCVYANRLFFVRIVFLSSAILLMFFVQSRGAMVALVSVILVNAWAELIHHGRGRRLAVTLGFALLLLVMSSDIGSWAYNFLLYDVLLIDDPYRGLGTGFTGRVWGWQLGLEALASAPIIGHGLDLYSYVHNGFIRFAAEGGLVLLVMMLVFILRALRSALFLEGNHLRVTMLVGYSVYIFFTSRSLNLNIASIIFFMSFFDWTARRQSHDLGAFRLKRSLKQIRHG